MQSVETFFTKYALLSLSLLVLAVLFGGCLQETSSEQRVTSVPAIPPTSVPVITPAPNFSLPYEASQPFPGYLSRSPQATYPEITPSSAQGIERVVISYQFPFENNTVQLSVPVNISIYHGAHLATKNITVFGPIPQSILLRDYYLSFVGDPEQDEFFSAFLGELRQYRSKWNLTEDEYLELMSTCVQSLPYQPHSGGSKFPLETFVDRSGDCDDKALLLSGLLAREGYNISLLYFEKERHVALAVAATANTFHDSGYAYIETTYPSYVGSVPDSIEDNLSLSSFPLLLRIGNGTRTYQSGQDTLRIDTVRKDAERCIRESLPGLPASRSALYQLAIQEDLEHRYVALNGQDAGYKEFVRQTGIYVYIQSHSYDRKGTIVWLDNF
jgi:hypothetical protein